MGTGLKGGATHYRSISENIGALIVQFTYKNGYFGIKGQGQSHTRNILSDDPLSTAKLFYNIGAYGGIETRKGKLIYTQMADGTIISLREKSTSDGTPAVEINIRRSNGSGSVKYQKIHFMKDGEK